MRKQNLLALMKVLTFSLIFFTTTIQAQDYAWTAAMGGAGSDRIHAIVSDTDGNVYVCGSFKYTVDFDPGVNETNITSTGSYDIFVQKLNANGELLWVKTFGSTAGDDALDLKLDADNNVYVTGYFKKTVDFDPGEGTNSVTSHGSSDIFLQKLDTDGNFQWVKTWGSTSIDEGYALTIDNDGNIFTTGRFKYTVDFDLGAGTAEITAPGSNKNVFIQKLNSNGDFLWVKGLTGASCNATAITTDASGNVFTTGSFTGTVDFNPNTAIENRTSHGINDIFTQKLTPNGDFLWVSTIEGTGDNTPSSLAVAPDGSVFVTGSFNDNADFDPSANTMDVPATGQADGFMQKLDNNGELMFVKRIGGAKGDRVNDIYIDNNNKVWITGYFHTSMILDAAHGTMVTSGQEDVFVANYELDGTLLSAFSYGSGLADKGNQILFSQNNLYTIGSFQVDVDFDTGIGIDNKNSNGLEDVFVQKLSFCIQADVPVTSASTTTVCAGEAVNLEIVSGQLNSATHWTWREGACTGDYVAEGTSITVNPTETTTYYVGGEGGCISSYSCQTMEIVVLSTPPLDTIPVTVCEGANYTFPDGTQEENITQDFSQSSVFSAASGCDSTIITEITVNPSPTVEETTQICPGENFTFADGTVIENIQTTTDYTSIFESVTGCDSSIVQTVIPSTPNATITVINDNTLSATIQKATYQWIDCADNTPIQDATGSTFTPTNSGEYAVIITNPTGCSTTSSCQAMTIVGTATPAREKQFDVYPNPMTTILNVAIRSAYKEGSLTLYHITGQRVYSQNLNGARQFELNVDNLNQGTYYLEIITDGIPAITKVVK